MKTCIRCHVPQDAVACFYDGLSTCKACHKEYNREAAAKRARGETPSRVNVPRWKLAPSVIKAFHRGVSEDVSKRPTCPSCGRVPSFGKTTEWAVMWGHRCPHGEPCPGWEQVPEGVSTCREQGCSCNVKVKVVA